MKNLVLCNIGARDVQLSEGGTLLELRPPRSQGRKVLNEYPDYAGRIVLPILEPALRFVLQSTPQETCNVVLFGTDQKEGEYLETDTLYFADIAAKRVAELFPFSAESRLLERANPAFYDETFELFGRLLPEFALGAYNRCFVILAGGTPACNSALLLQGVRLFGSSLQAVYIPPKKDALLLRIGRQIGTAFQEAAAIDHLNRLDFANALPGMEEIGADPGLKALVKYAAQRFAFDFPSARQSLQTAVRDGNRTVREFCDTLRHNLDRLPAGDDATDDLPVLIEELHWNAVITYQHRRYADFLGRVYRFQEATLRCMVEEIFGLSTDLAPAVRTANQQAWEGYIAANRPLVTFLESRRVDDQPLNWRSISRPVCQAMLSYVLDEKHAAAAAPILPAVEVEHPRYQALFKRVNALDRLVDFRHRTIIGHGFKGVSEQEILANSPDGLPPAKYLGKTVQILRKKDLSESAFHEIARFVVDQIKKEVL